MTYTSIKSIIIDIGVLSELRWLNTEVTLLITQLDFAILNFIQNNLTNSFTDMFMRFFTHLGDYGALWIITAVVMLMFKKTRKAGLCLAVSLVATAVIGNVILKNVFARLRPFIVENFPIIISPPGGYSFPSGHTSSSFAAATSLSLHYKKYAAAFYIVAALIGFSRIYLYVHYPSDVVAGAILGVVVSVVCHKILESDSCLSIRVQN